MLQVTCGIVGRAGAPYGQEVHGLGAVHYCIPDPSTGSSLEWVPPNICDRKNKSSGPNFTSPSAGCATLTRGQFSHL